MNRNVALAAIVSLAAASLAIATPASGSLAPAAPAATAPTAATYSVTSPMLNADQVASLSVITGLKVGQLGSGVAVAMARDGGAIPMKSLGAGSKDEEGRATTLQSIDMQKVRSLELPSRDRVAGLASQVVGRTAPWQVTWSVSTTRLETFDRKGARTGSMPLEVVASARFALAGVPVIGPGARVRLAFGSGGKVTSVVAAMPAIEEDATPVTILTVSQAQQQCVRVYPADTKLSDPRLVYVVPAMASLQTGRLTGVKKIVPHYQCQPAGGDADGVLIPAAPSLSPQVTLTAARSGSDSAPAVTASVSVRGTKAVSIRWSSPLANLGGETGGSVSFTGSARSAKGVEPTGLDLAHAVTVTVTDANGVVSSATADLSRESEARVSGVGGGVGGVLASGSELACCSDWACAAKSVEGFRDTMAANGVPSQFHFKYANAWENDYRSATGTSSFTAGADSTYIDNVDIGWYTGHGGPGAFTFSDSNYRDTSIVPSDARWGNKNLEWLNLQSCQVLQDSSSSTAVARWGSAFDGLHVLNGFHTNASCGNGDFGQLFAMGLFGIKLFGVQVVPPLTVANAWAFAALLHDETGHVYRSMAPYDSKARTTMGDYFWGQGPTGPDIPAGSIAGFNTISGTV